VGALLVGGTATTSLRCDGGGERLLLLELSLTATIDRRRLHRRINHLRVGRSRSRLSPSCHPTRTQPSSWVVSPIRHFFEPKQPVPPHHPTGRLCHCYHCHHTTPSICLSCACCGRKGVGSGAVVAEHFRACRMDGNVAPSGFSGCRHCIRLGCGGCR
jgi:hypothetical protein